MKRTPLVLVFLTFAGALFVATRSDGQEPARLPQAAATASPDPAPGPEFYGLRLGSSRASVEELLTAKGIEFRQDAWDRLQFAGSPDPDFLPAPKVSHVVFDRGDRLVIIDFRWPLRPEAPNPFDKLLRGLWGRYGPTKRTGTRDYLWNLEDPKNVSVHLYENLRRVAGVTAPETALRYAVSGANIAQGVDRLD